LDFEIPRNRDHHLETELQKVSFKFFSAAVRAAEGMTKNKRTRQPDALASERIFDGSIFSALGLASVYRH
jgi:hypothetical protein